MNALLRPLALAILVSLPAIADADWPHLRGPAFDGTLAAPGTFESGKLGLDLAWRVPLGSGYSGIAVAGGRAVTLFAEGEANWAAAFDVASGQRLWSQRIGDINKGHDGSDDGPLSSPVVAGGIVFALDPTGVLHALSLADGKPVWTKSLVEEFGAKAPEFGFTTTPLVAGGTLVVLAGGSEGRTIVGLDAKSGKTSWTHGEDGAAYQSPAVMKLAGTTQVVAVTAKSLTGIDARSGTVLWNHALGEQDRAFSSVPTFAGEDRLLVMINGDAAVYHVKEGESGLAAEEVYRSKTLGGNYAPPVYRDGYLYGYRGNVLSCMRASDGERMWRSREPGGDGLILIDRHLVVFGELGNVVVVEASPEGYVERARLQALDGSGLTWPSFAAGRIFVRNLAELAAVSITEGGVTLPATAATAGDHEFGRWLAKVKAAGDQRALVDQLFEKYEQAPIVDGEWVTFLYRGPASDVAIMGTMLDNEVPETLQRVEGTDLFYRTYRLEPGSRWEYHFQIDFENWTPDPRNPRQVPAVEGDDPMSELVTPGYTLATFTAEPKGPRGKLDEFKLPSAILGYEKNVRVWLPPDYDKGERSYPLLVVNDGQAWIEKGLLTNTLDNLVGKSVAPVIVAFVDPTRAWWIEAGGARTADYARMLGEELVPAMKERYRIAADKGAHGIMGNRYFAFSSAYTALKHPEIFGRVGMQSVFTGLGAGDELDAMIAAHNGPTTTFYLDWNRWDERNVDRDWNLGQDSATLATQMKKNGYTVSGGEVLDSQGWGGWRNRADRMLVAMFPMR